MRTLRKIKNRRKGGFSLVEVLVSIVILALLATAVATFLLYWQQFRDLSNDLTIALNDAQEAIESEYARLRAHIDGGDIEELETQDSEVMEVFGQNVTVYTISGEAEFFSDLDKGNVKLYGGLANTFKKEPSIPEIKTVTIEKLDKSQVDVIYFPKPANDDGVRVGSIERNDELNNLKKYIYWWYLGNKNHHVLPLSDETVGEMSNLIAICPQDFEIVPSTSTSDEDFVTFDKLSDYKGRLIACLVIPGTSEGYMGKSVVSNYIYISALPELASGNYIALYDASVISYKDEDLLVSDTDGLTIKNLPSEIAYGGNKLELKHTTGSKVFFDKGGTVTSSDYPTRFFTYSPSSASTVTVRFSQPKYVHAFAVASEIAGEYQPYLSCNAGGKQYTLLQNQEDGGNWQIQYGYTAVTLSGDVTFTVGGTNVNIAELILVENPSTDDINNIRNYLSAKYGI